MNVGQVVQGAGRAVAGAWVATVAAGVLVPGPELVAGDPRAPRRPSRVSIVVPLRNEARNVTACLTALCAQDHPDFEILAVDDASSDATAELVLKAAADDGRVRLVAGEPLPAGWVGKPWACHQGAMAASGEWIIFVDADVRLAPDAVRLLLADAEAHGAEVVSWVGRQRLETFSERVVNPCVFLYIASLTPLPLARHPRSPIVAVNGQLLAFSRHAYQRLGGHEAVRDAVVEDLALGRAAKRRYGRGYRFVWVRGLMTTRMYTNLDEIRQGWGKNLALGAAVVGIPPGAMVAGAALGGVAPWVGVAARLAGRRDARPWALAAVAQAAAVGIFTRRFSGESPLWGCTTPLGQLLVTAIAVDSWRARRRGLVPWRGRDYAARR